MLLAEFANAMTQRGCVGNERNFCGSYKGYPFSVVFVNGRQNGMTSFFLQMQFAQKVPTALYRRAIQALKGLARVGRNSNDKTRFGTTVQVKQEENFAAAFDGLLATLAEAAPEMGLTVPDVCPLCHSQGCDSYAYLNGSYRPVHAHCVQTMAYTKQSKVEDNRLNGSYVTGVIGALLGGLLGVAVNVAVLWFGDMILALLCALIPLFAYYGYKLFRGKMTRTVVAVVLLVSLLMVPMMDYGFYAVDFWITDGVFFTPLIYLGALLTYPGEFAGELFQILIFVGLGFFIVRGIVSRTGAHEMRDTTFTAVSLRPIDGRQPAAIPRQPVMSAAPAMQATPAAPPMTKDPAEL